MTIRTARSPYDYEQLVLKSNKEGMDFLRKGQYKEAFEQLKYAEAVVVSKSEEETNLMSVTCNNLGCYYKKELFKPLAHISSYTF